MHDGMPYGRNQGQGQGHSWEVDRQSPTGLIFIFNLCCVVRRSWAPVVWHHNKSWWWWRWWWTTLRS